MASNNFSQSPPNAPSDPPTEEFIQKSRLVHKDKYTYTSVNYITTLIKVKIMCNKCNSVFKMRPSDHLLGAGCPSCAKSGFDQTK